MSAALRLPLANGRGIRRALGRSVRRQRALTVATVVLAGLAALAGVVAPWVVGLIVDAVQRGGDAHEIVILAIWVAGAGGLSAVLSAASGALVARIGQRVLARMREDVVGAALRLPPGRLEETGRGDLLARVGDDVAVVSQAVVALLAPWVGALLTVLLTIAGLFALNPWLAVAGLASVPVYVLSLRWYLPRAAPRYNAERAAFGDRAESLIASLEGLPTVHAYGAEAAHLDGIVAASDRARGISRAVLWFSSAWGKWMNFAELVGLGTIIAVGFALVSFDAATVGAVTAAALYFHRLFNPIGIIVHSFDEMQSAAAGLARMVGVIEAGERERVLAPIEERPRGDVRADGLTHRYGDVPVVHDVSLEVAHGEQVAVVGASGAGKSTLAVVLAGLVEPAEGAVTVHDRPVEEFAGTHPRPVVLVSQEAHVFAGPLAADLRLAKHDASDAEVAHALEVAGASDWVAALPHGAETVVGELGHALTPEQVAQLALARAVLADPAVLILDEATAESGSRGAARLERAAAAALEGRTGIVVAHRLQQAQVADRILVMAEGRVIEQGTHVELLEVGGAYAELWRAYSTGGETRGRLE
jgi:ATP-binding cassette subfamily C protein